MTYSEAKDTAKKLKSYLMTNGFKLNVKTLKGSMKNYFMIGARKVNGTFHLINTEALNDFLNANFIGFDGKEFRKDFSYNGGLSTHILKSSVNI